MDVYARLKELGCELPAPAAKGGLYKPVNQVGNLLFVSGQAASFNGEKFTGCVGKDRTVEEGQQAAKLCALNALAALDAYTGDLNKIKKIVKTLGFVYAVDGFAESPKVINGCSQLMMDIWGEENGLGARSALPINGLPGNVTAEIEFVFELK